MISYADLKAERDNALALLAETAALMQQITREHQQAYAALDELREGFWAAEEDREAWAQAGAQALAKAFPGLHEDFTPAWFLKAANIIVNAVPESEEETE